jgi:hypothetical protein
VAGPYEAWPNADAREDGALRTARRVADFDRERVERGLPRGVAIENGYTIWAISLWSGGEETRATVAVPYRADPPPRGWHVVANNHGTTGLAAPCALAGTEVGMALAATFAARGFIGVAPEYAGFADGKLHPYLVAESESRAVLDAVRAARALARWQGWPLSGRCALTGTSQGGHATLAAAARWRRDAPELEPAAFAVAAPASAWEEHWRLGALRDGDHLVYHALLLYAWAHHYGWRGPSIWSARVGKTIDREMRSACAWSPAGDALLAKRLPMRAGELFSREFLQAYRSGWWGRYAAFRTWFGVNRIGPWRGGGAVKIFQGSADTAVPERATRQLALALRMGGVEVEYEVAAGAGHHDTAFGFLGQRDRCTEAAIAWLRDRLDRRT